MKPKLVNVLATTHTGQLIFEGRMEVIRESDLGWGWFWVRLPSGQLAERWADPSAQGSEKKALAYIERMNGLMQTARSASLED